MESGRDDRGPVAGDLACCPWGRSNCAEKEESETECWTSAGSGAVSPVAARFGSSWTEVLPHLCHPGSGERGRDWGRSLSFGAADGFDECGSTAGELACPGGCFALWDSPSLAVS